MGRCVALLRGVNVGTGKRVPMADLRTALAALGYRDVVTLLNSGNAVFTASARLARGSEHAIHDALVERLGVDVPVIVKRAADLAAIVEENPFPVTGPEASRLLVGFASERAALAALRDLGSLVRAREGFHVGRHALYAWCPDGSMRSLVAKELLGRRGRAITTRNWATVGKLHALVCGSAER